MRPALVIDRLMQKLLANERPWKRRYRCARNKKLERGQAYQPGCSIELVRKTLPQF